MERVRELAQNCVNSGGGLIPLLQEIQAEFNYLPPESLRVVSEVMNLPLSQVYSVATFYHSFSLRPRGRHLVLACLGTACHVRGGERIADEIARKLHISRGETTPDGEFTFETANCLGACALGPVVVVDNEYHARMTAAKVASLIDGLTTGDGRPSAGRPREAVAG